MVAMQGVVLLAIVGVDVFAERPAERPHDHSELMLHQRGTMQRMDLAPKASPTLLRISGRNPPEWARPGVRVKIKGGYKNDLKDKPGGTQEALRAAFGMLRAASPRDQQEGGIEGFLRLEEDPESHKQQWLLEHEILGGEPYEEHKPVENKPNVTDAVPASWDQVEQVDHFGFFNDMVSTHVNQYNGTEGIIGHGRGNYDLNIHALKEGGYTDGLIAQGDAAREVYKNTIKSHQDMGMDPVIQQIVLSRDPDAGLKKSIEQDEAASNLDGSTEIESHFFGTSEE